jgi:membrane protein YqaA with SNARE-associated domain
VALLPPTLAAMGLSIGVVVLLITFRESLQLIGGWGYVGVALGELANSAAIFFPTPGPAYTFAMGSVLDPFALGIVGGLSAACGELLGYYLGARGRKAIGSPWAMRRMQVLTSRWGGGALLAFAILPVPFDVAGIWAGAARYPLPKFLLFVVPGKVVKVTTVALAGSYGFYWFAGSVG